ncbi:hypothetical protein NIE88_14555 [Sporolactobacillus shoreicorticis]|uniref:Uncharacterized protein n=1 Tax=Sporolactobacillus shoreicorticis TaxID=1923877 RepID=A0ABW5S0V0_9BACL|nr:hypothetical protein [Sporolactobacillus shoreicorticis]MCO7126988.1 hypothetical protein [Sporolactobacillus shoreicorticis]
MKRFIDLRDDQELLVEVTSVNDDQYILTRLRQEASGTMRFFSIFNTRTEFERPLNTVGVPCNVGTYGYSYLLDGDRLLTDVSEPNKTSIYSLNVTNGAVKQLICMQREVNVTILDGHYALLTEDLEPDDENFDVHKEICGDYQSCSLLDLKYQREYPVNDAKLRLGFRDYLVPFHVENKIHLLFEEAYMDDYELEDAFNKGIKKEDFFNHGYRESINIITLEKFVEAVKTGQQLPFKILHQSEWSGNTRYVGMNETHIFYRVHNFGDDTVSIFSADKRDFEPAQIRTFTLRKDWDRLNGDVENCLVYQEKFDETEENAEIVQLFPSRQSCQFAAVAHESFIIQIGSAIYTRYWSENEDGANYQEFVRIIDANSGRFRCYKGDIAVRGNYIFLVNMPDFE